MRFRVNDGSRPDLLELGRRATGEVDGPVPEVYRRELEEARRRLPPLDLVALRARAERLDPASDPDRPLERAAPALPAWRRWLAGWGRSVAVPVLVAALALVAVWPGARGPGERAKGEGGAELRAWVLVDGAVRPFRPDLRLRAGDRVQFAYRAAGLDELVLLSVDGTGRVTVFWPEEGDEAVPVEPRGEHLLDGSVELDDAPGPEVFVGLFGFDRVEDARRLVERAWADGGVDALLGLDDEYPDIDVVVVEKEEGP